MRLSFFSMPKAKAFEYKPVFFDPEKESLNSTQAKQGTDKDAAFKARLRKELDSKWNAAKRRKKKQTARNLQKLLFYLTVVLLLLYLVLITN